MPESVEIPAPVSTVMAAALRTIARARPVAVRWASEAAIYGRFGYGVASQLLRIDVDRVDATMRTDLASDDGLRLRMVTPADVVADIEQVERELLGRRPGQFERDK